MKKLITLITCSLFFISCSNDDGIGNQGPQGPPGEPGVNIEGQTFEFEAINFEYLSDINLYSTIIQIPEDIEITPDDAVLVYRLGFAPGDDGQDIETWSLIPQNFFLDEGTIQYVYNHTDFDIEIVIDGNFDLSNLDSQYTEDQIFRFVVVPSNFPETSGVDVSNYNAVKAALDLQDRKIPKKGI